MNSTEERDILSLLESIPDPELMVVNIVELGIVRQVALKDDSLEVVITPTYSACPALHTIENDIENLLHLHGWQNVRILHRYAPPWTTEWLSEATKEKLRSSGIAPPTAAPPDETLIPLPTAPSPAQCPFCGSTRTERKSEFGATACKSFFFCHVCRQPFELFKSK
jgi:ring-1,2-phenylacetyl-CoA epoxidase subunit PaaD